MPPLALILAVAAVTPLAAQESLPRPTPMPVAPSAAGPVIRPGDRVQLHPREPGIRPMVGRWLGTADGQVRLEVSGEAGQVDTTTVDLGSLALIQRSAGRSRDTAKGAGIGAMIGLMAGAAAGFASGPEESGLVEVTAGQKALLGALAGVGLGAVVGAIIGSTTVSDRWEVVPIRPAPGGVGPAVTFRF